MYEQKISGIRKENHKWYKFLCKIWHKHKQTKTKNELLLTTNQNINFSRKIVKDKQAIFRNDRNEFRFKIRLVFNYYRLRKKKHTHTEFRIQLTHLHYFDVLSCALLLIPNNILTDVDLLRCYTFV